MTEGELWAREVLHELRAARYAPAAWTTFLRRSFQRARLRRRERAHAHRQIVLLAGSGIAAAVAVALGGEPALAVLGLGWWLVVLLMLDWHLGMLERPDGRPLDGLGRANVLSLVRTMSVPLLIVVPPIAFAFILLAAGITDVLDGWTARRRDEITRLGLWLDPAVDALVLAVAAGVLADRDRLSPWVAALVIARYLMPWTVVTAAYFARARAPSRKGYVSGRAAGVLVLVGLALAALRFPAGAPVAVIGAAGGLFAFTLTVARTLRPMRDDQFAAPSGRS